MTESNIIICRLCKSTELLRNLYDEQGLLEEINLCIGLKIYRDDGLPSMICKLCRKKIKKFYNFQQKCLKVNSELNNMKQSSLTSEIRKSISTEYLENGTCYSTVNIKIENIDDEYNDSQIFRFSGKTFIKSNEDESDQHSIQCELCGSIYESKTEYKTHLASHSKTRMFQCQFCNKHFTRAESREIHVRAHLGIRPYICEICGKSSTKRQDLIRHKKIHSEERNYECLICGRRFKRSADLSTHDRTHSGARPYKCPSCGKGYTSHSGMRKHVKKNICKENSIKS